MKAFVVSNTAWAYVEQGKASGKIVGVR